MIGFVGLGVMGEPICRNLARKCGDPVLGFDVNAEPLARLKRDGVQAAASVREIAERAGSYIVDLSTTTVALARAAAAGHRKKYFPVLAKTL